METPFLEIPEEQYPFPENWEQETALELFDTSYLRALTEASAIVAPEEKYLVFISGGATFAISLHEVAEVCRSLPVTPLPGVPEWMAGVVNLRGDLLAVIDPEANSASIKTKIIVLGEPHKGSLGLMVDQVKEITQLPASKIESAVPDGAGLRSFSRGCSEYRDSSVLVLDTGKLFAWSEMKGSGEQ